MTTYYSNTKVDNIDYIEAQDLEDIETGFANVDSDKANKVAGATNGNVAGVNASGDLTDSGYSVKDEDNMVSNSATALATQQSIKAYVDTQLTASDLDFQGDSGGALSIDLDSETLTISGGTGIDTTGLLNDLSIAIDSTVTTLTGTQTLTNKTLTSPTINTPTITGNTTFSDGLYNFNIASHDGTNGLQLGGTLVTSSAAELNLLDGITAIKDEDNMLSNSATSLATQQSIKAYVDAQIATEDTLAELNDTVLTAPADSHFLVHNGTNWINETGATARTSLGVSIGSDVQAYDAGLGSISGLTTAADKMIYTTASDTYAVTALTSTARSLLDDTSTSAMRTTLGLAIGTDVQAYDAQLADVAGLTPTDGNIIVGNGTNFVAESGATARTSLGLGTGDSPQFTSIQLGHSTDTTITRSSAGVAAIEGSEITTNDDTQTLTNKTLTSPVIGTKISDTNGNELVNVTATTSAVNEFTVANAATGNGPTLSATGTDLNVDINITPKGTGTVKLGGNLDFNGNTVHGVDSTEMAILDGATVTTAELNILDGVTSTAAELNILDGVTSTAAELNILDGVTSTTAELNILDGVTSTTVELNYNDITTLGTVQASKAVTADASGNVTFPDNDKVIFGASGDLEIYHTPSGNDSVIKEIGAGNLNIQADNLSLLNAAGSEYYLRGYANGAVKLYDNGVEKLATTSTGVDVTGSVTADTSLKVGTIGAVGNTANDVNIYSTGSGHNGLRMHVNGVLPTDNTGTIVDADADLGDPNYRFKDLYLSGAAYLGGTSSSNALDDYEEGTWTPTLTTSGTNPTVTYTLQKGRYVKIGDLVTVSIDVRWSAQSGGSNTLRINGIPFAFGDAYYGGAAFEHSGSFTYGSGRTTLIYEGNQNASSLTFLVGGSGIATSGYPVGNLGTGSGYVILSFSYRAT